MRFLRVHHFLLVLSIIVGASAAAEEFSPDGSELPSSEILHVTKSHPKSVEGLATDHDIDVALRVLAKEVAKLDGTIVGVKSEGHDANFLRIAFRTEQARLKWREYRSKKGLPRLYTVWRRPDESLVLIRFEVALQPPVAVRDDAKKGTPPQRKN